MKLKKASLNWGLKHLARENDTDLFPRPFEIDIIKDNWAKLLPVFTEIDITNYQWQSFRKLLIPKDEFSFRNVCQLDPIDSLIFASIIKEIGKKIENKRIPYSDNKVFSYRFEPTNKGNFYGNKNYWCEFWKISKENAKQCKQVVITDISDFYNQIYHHTVENQLAACSIQKGYITAILNMLKNITLGVSKGIPIGPHAAHILAELSLIPIDEYLLLKGYKFCRYVDDIHIFCESWEDGQNAIFDLAYILDKVQKLSLNRQKTLIIASQDFIKKAEVMLMDNPINEEEDVILKVIKNRIDDPYVKIRIGDLSEDDLLKLSKENIESVLKSYLDKDETNYSRLRWFLRRLAQVGVPGAVEFIINNLHKLAPAISDSANYLNSAKGNYKGNWKDIGNKLLDALKLPLVQKNEYLQVIILSLFSRIRDLNNIESLIQCFDKVESIAKRKIVMAAIEAKASAWLRSFKDNYAALDPWLKRSIIFSSKTFPNDEKKFWLKYVKKGANDLEKAIIESIK